MSMKNIRYLLLSLLTGIVLLLAFYINGSDVAQGSTPQRGSIVSYDGSVKVFPNGRTPEKRPEDHGDLRSDGYNRDQLWVAGDSFSRAHIKFPNQGPLVKAGEDNTNTFYTFPCRIRLGGTTVAWGVSPVGYSICEGVVVSLNNSSSVASKASSQELANGELAPGEITLKRLEEQTLIRAYQQDNDIAVDVLVGTIQIAGLNGEIFDVGAGERYVQTPETGNIEAVDVTETARSPSVEDFLDQDNWPSDVEQLLDDLKSQLPGVPQLTEAEQEILNTHNELRAKVDVPPLSWSPELARFAQEWADELSRLSDRNLAHRGGGASGAGENIAAGGSVDIMLNLWAEEEDDYNPSTGQCRSGRTCGHYTQMVWRNTTEIGCGIASHGIYGRVMVCNYSPPGNFIGQRPY